MTKTKQILKVLGLISFLFFCVFNHIAQAQLASITPSFPTPGDDVTITFDASLGSGGLAGYTGDVYAHTGVITNQSNSDSDWKHVKTDWGQNTLETKLTKIDGDIYELIIQPSIKDYYGVPDEEQIQKIALVFRSGVPENGSYLEGKTTTNGDIFLNIFNNEGFFIQLIEPASRNIIVDENQEINIEANVSSSSKIKVYDNNILVDSLMNATQYSTTINASTGGHTIRITAENIDTLVETSFTYIISESPDHANRPFGSQIGPQDLGNEMVRLVLEAPLKQNCLLHSNLTDWKFDETYWMTQTHDRRFFWIDVNVSSLQGEPLMYQFIVDEDIVVADPLSELILDRGDDQFIGENTFPNLPRFPDLALGRHVTVHEAFEYSWQINNFNRPAQEEIVIYEILMRDFIHTHSYENLIDTIYYLKALGVNAIELMPINEFEGNLSWGYNPSFQGAVDKYYGTPEKFKAFIDACHANGIAVILDVVFNHVFSQSPLAQLYWDAANFRPASNNPWLNVEAKHPFNVGYDVNHRYIGTEDWMHHVLKRWAEDYRIDGFRFDLSKGFTQTNNPTNVGAWGQYDASRIAILKRMADRLWTVDPESYVILEHFAQNTEEKELAEYGMMLWGNMNHNYTEASMGYVQGSNSSLRNGLANERGWSKNHLVTYMESHDEERMVYKNQTYGNSAPGYSVKDPFISIARAELAATFFYLLPGPKMMWQFEELGFPYSINRCEDGTINDNCRLSPKPIRWDFFENENRRDVFDVTRDLLHLRNNYEVFHTGNLTHDLTKNLKQYNFTNADLDVLAIGNFDVESQTIQAEFSKTGTWFEYFSGEEIEVNASTMNIDLAAGEYRLYLDQPVERLSVLNPNISGTSFPTGASSKVILYPNPVIDNKVIIKSENDRLSIDEISLFSLNGSLITSTKYQDILSLSVEYTFQENLAPGIYIIHIKTNEGVVEKMIVVGL